MWAWGSFPVCSNGEQESISERQTDWMYFGSTRAPHDALPKY